MERYAEEIGGQFSEYDKSKSVIIIPLAENRYQAVLGVMKFNEKLNKTGIEFSSKVCPANDDINYRELVEENARTTYAKFVLVDEYVKVEGSAYVENLKEEAIKEIIQEVANKADEWEYRLTGLDVN